MRSRSRACPPAVYTMWIALRHGAGGEPSLQVGAGTFGGNGLNRVDNWSSPAPQAVEYAARLRTQCNPPRVA